MSTESLHRIFVKTEDLRPGMVLNEDVSLEFGAVLIPKDTVLTQRTIERLQMLDIKGVYVLSSDANLPQEAASQDVLREVYDNAHDAIKNTMDNVRHNGRVDVASTMNVVEEIVDKINNCTDIVRGLQELKTESEYTYKHCVDVAILCGLMGRWLKASDRSLRHLVYAGFMHDIGKAKIPLDILNKPDKLTQKEFAVMKNHPLYGYEIISKSGKFDKNIYYGVLFHHEREDGSGYPFGLNAPKIPIVAKIVAVMDTYDAMISQRPYKDHYSPYYVIDVLQWNCIGKLNLDIVRTFIFHIVDLFVGDNVELSNGEIGRVVYLDKALPTRPLIELADGSFIDLREHYELYIKDVL